MIKKFSWKVEFQDIKIIGNDIWGVGGIQARITNLSSISKLYLKCRNYQFFAVYKIVR